MRQYLILKSNKRLRDALANFEELHRATVDLLRSLHMPNDLLNQLDRKTFEIVAAPSAGIRIRGDSVPAEPSEMIIAFDFTDLNLLRRLRDFLITNGLCGDISGDPTADVRNMGADPSIQFCSHVAVDPSRIFANRSRAHEMMRTNELRDLSGQGVNVVILDRGLNREAIEQHRPESWGGDLLELDDAQPGAAPRTSHGMFIARNILKIAPEATLFDLPLLPPHISRPNVFASQVNAKISALIQAIKARKQTTGSNTAWILVNAWGVFNRTAEEPPGDYTANTHVEWINLPGKDLVVRLGHPLNMAMNDLIDEGIDVVFGAGNCGLFTPINRCGRHDRGPGNSIWGANAHPRVLTVGAVSANDAWIGYSSEGPAPWGEASKPDVCAPSNFHEDDNPSMVNSGTSAATALTSGVIAAIRSSADWGPLALSPEALKAAINASARGQEGGWNSRIGHGVLDAGRLIQQLAGD